MVRLPLTRLLMYADCSYLFALSCLAWWRHQMETFYALVAICAGNSPVPVNSPHKGQWRGALIFSLICVWINGWANNRKAGDLRRYRAHYDAIVMEIQPKVWHYITVSTSCCSYHFRISPISVIQSSTIAPYRKHAYIWYISVTTKKWRSVHWHHDTFDSKLERSFFCNFLEWNPPWFGIYS